MKRETITVNSNSRQIAGIVPKPVPGLTRALETQLKQAIKLINAADVIVVAAHMGPDGDAIGSSLALARVLREQGKKAYTYNRDGAPYNLEFLSGSEGIITEPRKLPESIDLFVVLDCSALHRVDSRLPAFNTEKTKMLCIDHHQTLENTPFDVMVHDTEASSVGEMIYRLILAMGARLTQPVAECLFVAVHTDTGSFRYSNSTPAALAIAGELVRAKSDVWYLCSEVYENYPVGRIRLLNLVLGTLQLSSCGRFAFIHVTQEMFQRTNTGPQMLDGFINYARGISGVEVAAQLRQVGAKAFRVSLRSRGRVNVASLAEAFDGGGHHHAAGCGMNGSEDQVIKQLTQEFSNRLK
jgi:phosphoesterase RecJ-like protein